jgi:hypothetical protein
MSLNSLIPLRTRSVNHGVICFGTAGFFLSASEAYRGSESVS